jgi:hypothetical protein
MFIEAGRDIAAMFALDERLSHLREEYIELVLSGRNPGDDFWPEHEATIVNEIKHRFFSSSIESGSKSSDPVEAALNSSLTSSKQDISNNDIYRLHGFDLHSQKLLEHAIWMIHEITKQIPYLGQKEYVTP